MFYLLYAVIVALQAGSVWTTFEFRSRGLAEEAIPWNRWMMQRFGYAPLIVLKLLLLGLIAWVMFGFPFSASQFCVIIAALFLGIWDTGGNLLFLYDRDSTK